MAAIIVTIRDAGGTEFTLPVLAAEEGEPFLQSDVEPVTATAYPEEQPDGTWLWPALTWNTRKFCILPPEIRQEVPSHCHAVALGFSTRVTGSAGVFALELRLRNRAPRDLYRRFAMLPLEGTSLADMAKVVNFARLWGPLNGPPERARGAVWFPGLPTMELAHFEALCRSSGGGGGCIVELWVEWQREAWLLKTAIGLREALRSKDPAEKLGQIFSVEGAVVTWLEPSPVWPAQVDYRKWVELNWTHRLPLGSDMVRWGVELLEDFTRSALREKVRVDLAADYNRRRWTGQFREEVRPLSLAGVLWLQFRDSLFSRRQDKHCSVCGRPVPVKARGRVPDVCGPTCRKSKARAKQ